MNGTRSLTLLLGLLLVSACRPTCENACRKLIQTCEAGIPSYSTASCTADCELIEDEYAEHDYLEQEQAAFQTQLECIMDASCEDLLNEDAPACYVDETTGLYIF